MLPDGVSYRLLALPDSATMRPGLLKKIGDLVKAVIDEQRDQIEQLERYIAG